MFHSNLDFTFLQCPFTICQVDYAQDDDDGVIYDDQRGLAERRAEG